MSDEHSGLSHDLPEYTPNWPVPVKVKAKVMKGTGGWAWVHSCPRAPLAVAAGVRIPTQPAAFEAALKHVQGCWR
jgi:hypothetical protein